MSTGVVRRVLDGGAQWGSLTIQPDRFGTRYLLLVYPPGTTASERRRVRVWRAWPVWGALLWILSEMTLTQRMDPWFALAISTGLLVASGSAAYVIAGAPRGRVRTLAATLLPRRYDPVSTDLCRTMDRLAERLRQADAQRELGLVEPAQFELTWWQVYDEMALARYAGIHDAAPGSAQ